ncbi:hypothetical protein PHYSODRAFT_361972 [Phytophthora sojae]|uniref:Auto-transporter adhesin head GIN domain-containing protein n=1 Tax=Phytophthora sojae (strain P6497) TaxID=1094619 RepID=G5A5T7_PHYSP|nr:hypothetical protein PHYSODRAFT_361972 [Phytophthora sojae]EGZ08692.1 hypothetical protein PHYSODRAFT_361972 [Phytophthora sojae]|eukprot:XP_009535325.1 hypothetical protein PHYSODRAFT_361972 [Phytophthora sojae]
MNIQALLLVAASMTARASAEFTVTSGTTEAATSTSENAAFVKQWTLNAANSADTIDSIDLDLAGRVYVSYVSGLPSGVLGYVNVTGDSQTVVDAVTVSNDDDTDNDNDDNDTNDTDGELNVVVEDGVLVSSSTTAELQVEASGSSAVYVSAANTDVSVRQLQLEAAGTSKIEFHVKSVSVTELELETQGTGTICTSAETVTATNYQGTDASRISMPNASSKYDSTGSFACDVSSVPAREPSCVSSACASSSTSGTTVGTAGSGTSTSATVTSAPTTTTDDDDNASDDTNASSTPRLAALAAAAIGVVAASLL